MVYVIVRTYTISASMIITGRATRNQYNMDESLRDLGRDHDFTLNGTLSLLRYTTLCRTAGVTAQYTAVYRSLASVAYLFS